MREQEMKGRMLLRRFINKPYDTLKAADRCGFDNMIYVSFA